MAIQVFCSHCKTSHGLGTQVCSKCGHVFGRDRRYRVCVSHQGRRVTRVVDNLALAREVEAALKGDLVRGELDIARPKPVPTLGEVWARYLPWAQEHKKSWIDDLRYYRRHLEPRFARKPLDAITPLDLERLKSDLKKGRNRRGKPFAPATIKHILVIIRRLYNLAAKWGLYDGPSPMRAVAMPKVDNRRTEFLSMADLTRLWATLDSWPCRESAALVKFALLTGLRRGELFKLTWEDVDFERGLVRLRSPKGGETTTIPVSPQALEVLRGLPRASEYIFPGKDGRRRTNFNGPWRRIREAAGLPPDFRFHGLRHHFAATLVSHGVDLYTVQALLTHRDAKTTQRYAHLAPGALREAAKLSGQLLAPGKSTDQVAKGIKG